MGDKQTRGAPGNPSITARDTSRNATKHGLNSMKRSLNKLGSRGIDRRTRYGKALFAWKAHLITDLGGDQTVTTQELQVIDTIIKDKLILDSIDVYILELGDKVINRRSRRLYPIVLQRTALADSMVKKLTILGLSRRIAEGPDPAAYLAAKGDS